MVEIFALLYGAEQLGRMWQTTIVQQDDVDIGVDISNMKLLGVTEQPLMF